MPGLCLAAGVREGFFSWSGGSRLSRRFRQPSTTVDRLLAQRNFERLIDSYAVVVLDMTAWTGVKIDGPVSGGSRNEVWRGTSQEGAVAVRRSRRSPDSLEWELDLMASLDEAGFVVPVPVATDTGSLSHNGVVVQRWIEGRPPSTSQDWQLVAHELQRLHRFASGRSQRPGCVAVPALGRNSRSVDADLSVLPAEVSNELLAVFEEFSDVETSVIHGDPGPSNIRIGLDGRIGLLDWDESRVDVVVHDLSNLGVQVLSDDEHGRALELSDAWEAANAWTTEPDYARRRLADLRQRRNR
jgi:Ser/Thr protein kinase RdoA (MazF antagonist)